MLVLMVVSSLVMMAIYVRCTLCSDNKCCCCGVAPSVSPLALQHIANLFMELDMEHWA